MCVCVRAWHQPSFGFSGGGGRGASRVFGHGALEERGQRPFISGAEIQWLREIIIRFWLHHIYEFQQNSHNINIHFSTRVQYVDIRLWIITMSMICHQEELISIVLQCILSVAVLWLFSFLLQLCGCSPSASQKIIACMPLNPCQFKLLNVFTLTLFRHRFLSVKPKAYKQTVGCHALCEHCTKFSFMSYCA